MRCGAKASAGRRPRFARRWWSRRSGLASESEQRLQDELQKAEAEAGRKAGQAAAEARQDAERDAAEKLEAAEAEHREEISRLESELGMTSRQLEEAQDRAAAAEQRAKQTEAEPPRCWSASRTPVSSSSARGWARSPSRRTRPRSGRGWRS